MVEYNGINEHIEKTANLIFEDEGTVLPEEWGVLAEAWRMKNYLSKE